MQPLPLFSVEFTVELTPMTESQLSLIGGVAPNGGAVVVEAMGNLALYSCVCSYNRALTKVLGFPRRFRIPLCGSWC